MSDIPEDIRETVVDLMSNYGWDQAMLSGAMMGAILAERERCANVAETVSAVFVEESVIDQFYMTRRRVALAIRSGK